MMQMIIHSCGIHVKICISGNICMPCGIHQGTLMMLMSIDCHCELLLVVVGRNLMVLMWVLLVNVMIYQRLLRYCQVMIRGGIIIPMWCMLQCMLLIFLVLYVTVQIHLGNIDAVRVVVVIGSSPHLRDYAVHRESITFLTNDC